MIEQPGPLGPQTPPLGPASLPLAQPPDLAEIERIQRLEDRVLRNLQITLAYARLSAALDRRLGSGDANWCTFATWASKRAGRTIRAEELRARLRRRFELDDDLSEALRRVNVALLRRKLALLLGPEHLLARLLGLVEEVSRWIAEGNLKVFAELGPAFAALLALTEAGAPTDSERVESFLGRFRPGATEADGQELPRAAFGHYLAALAEPDPKRKAELILLANDQVGLHEQTRLQPNIAGALEAPIQRFAEWLRQDLRSRLPVWWLVRWQLGLLGFRPEQLLAPVVAVVTRIWCEEVTTLLMELPVPDQVLDLGWDLPPLPGEPMFPPSLRELEHPELLALLARVDRTVNTTSGSGARDWTSLPDRMHFITDLFRSRQRHRPLLEPPFSPEQCQAILEGRVPAGAL